MSGGNNNLTPTPGNWRDRQEYGANFHLLPPALSWPSVFRTPLDASGASQGQWQSLEERRVTGPIRSTSFPAPARFPMRILVVDDDMVREVNPGPRQITRESPQRVETRLAQEEKKLRKEIYNPTPKIGRRLCLYYRDQDMNNYKEKEKEDEGKRCAVCLDDFEPREEVMLTPCNHMFHENCIVPWLTNNTRCPVCRFAIREQTRENSFRSNNNTTNMAPTDIFAENIISIIRAMDEAFEWATIPR